MRKIHAFKTIFREIWKRESKIERSSWICEKFTHFIKKMKPVKERRKTKQKN